MKQILGVCIGALAVLSFSASLGGAADIENGKKLAGKCTVCHGKLGLSKGDPEVPNLAGQPALYIEKSLVAYQSGEREDRRMTIIAKPLSKENIKDLAAWFASVKVTAEAPM